MKKLAQDEGRGLAAKPAPKAGDRRKLQGDSTADKRYVAALKIMRRGGDPAKAHELLLAAAEDGDPFSIYALGTWFLHGSFREKKQGPSNSHDQGSRAEECCLGSVRHSRIVRGGDGVKKGINQTARFSVERSSSATRTPPSKLKAPSTRSSSPCRKAFFERVSQVSVASIER